MGIAESLAKNPPSGQEVHGSWVQDRWVRMDGTERVLIMYSVWGLQCCGLKRQAVRADRPSHRLRDALIEIFGFGWQNVVGGLRRGQLQGYGPWASLLQIS